MKIGNETLGGWKRTHLCTALTTADIGREVTVMGWVGRTRNLGGLIFVDLRDYTGILQCTFDQSLYAELFEKAFALRTEYTIAVRGTVRSRGEGAINPDLPTGEIEVLATEMKVFAQAKTTPFEIVEDSQVNEMLRLKYRYLDLRRPDMQRILRLRHKLTQLTREYFADNGFCEIETPILTKSTPEGARDYVVPSRVHPGKFYALPQSPQQYKQLLMLAGFDRYMQITKCMRDEDLRADRQPEFTQIDLEMSFVDVDDVISVNEGFLARVFKEILGQDLQLPLPRLTWKEAMERYGSDKPDIRFGMELQDLGEVLKDCQFRDFASALSTGGSVRGITVKGGYEAFSRKEIDKLTEFVKTYRAGGLAWVRLGDEIASSFGKFITPEEMQAIIDRMGAEKGDCILIVADAKNNVVFDALGALRCECARRLGLCDPRVFKPLWVVEFPLLEYDEEEGRYSAMHHPFTSPMDEDEHLLESDPGAVRAKAYDIVLNGYELGGGSIRIHSSELQSRMFRALGFTDEKAQENFGHLIEAFSYGAPPHGGLAYGLDRIVMLLAGRDNIKDGIAFPKVQNASEPMMNSPSELEEKQLRELCICLDVPEKEEQE